MASRDLRIVVSTDTRRGVRGLASMDVAAGKSARGMDHLKRAAAGAGVALAGGLAVGAKKAFDEFREAEKATAQTEAVLKSTGGTAKVTAKEIENLAQKISLKAGIDDEAIQSGENLLLTFTKIRDETGKGNQIFSRATQTITDMSVSLDQDLKSSAIQVGKALNDPIKGMTALQRVGVSFTQKQKDRVAGWVEEGKTLKAQRFILNELTTEFGGSAAAQADSADKMKVAWENMFESIGKAIGPTIERGMRVMTKFIRQMQNGKGAGGDFVDTLEDVGDAAKDVGETIGPPLKAIGEFALKHKTVTAMAIALGLFAKGYSALRGGGPGKLGSLGQAIGVMKPVPVFVTNAGGLPGGKPGVPGGPAPVPTKAKPRFFARFMGKAGWVLWPIAATEGASALAGDPQSGNIGPKGQPVVGGKTPGRATGGVQFDARTPKLEHDAHVAAMRDRALRIRSIGMEVQALGDRSSAGRRLVARLKDEGASTEQVSRAEKTARDRTMVFKQAQLALAEATGASRQKIERLRGQIEKLRSKRISVAVDINIPSLNVRAPGNLTGDGPQGPGMHTGDGNDGWGIEGGITKKVAKKVRDAAKANPWEFLMAGFPMGAVGSADLMGASSTLGPFAALGSRFGLSVTSGLRPGSITSSGNLSLHSSGHAIDVNAGSTQGMLAYAKVMAAVFGSRLKELIHTPLGFSIKNGQQVAPYATADHYDHVHVAMQRGGTVPGVGRGDKVPALLEPGEHIIRRSVATKIRPLLEALNVQKFSGGGTVKPEYARLIQMASKRSNIPANVLAGLIEVESGWNPNAVSPAGAFGLTQFMPGTAPSYGVMRGSSHKAVASQILGAAKYLVALGYAGDSRRALASYNGGPGNPQYGYADTVLSTAHRYSGLGSDSGGEFSGKKDQDPTRKGYQRLTPAERRARTPVKGRRTTPESIGIGQDVRHESRWDAVQGIRDDDVVTPEERHQADTAYGKRQKVLNARIKTKRARLRAINRALAGKLTPGTRKRLLGEKGRLIGDIGALIGESKGLTGEFQDLVAPFDPTDTGGADTSQADLAEEMRRLREAVEHQNAFADSVTAIGMKTAWKALGDGFSGQIAGYAGQRSRSAGDGVTGAIY